MVYKMPLSQTGGHHSALVRALQDACRRLGLSTVARPDTALAKLSLEFASELDGAEA
jgi:hypothetical protein